jgi:hypothetical protein
VLRHGRSKRTPGRLRAEPLAADPTKCRSADRLLLRASFCACGIAASV